MGWPLEAFLNLRQIVKPKSRPAPGGNLLYTKSDNKLYLLDSDGTEHSVAGTSGITVQDENATLATGVTQLDFQGTGITASVGTGEVIVTVPGETLPVTIIDAKGDLIVGTANDAASRFAAGANGTSLVYDSTQTTGVKAENRVKSIVAGTNVTVDSTDPLNPIVSASGGGGGAPTFPLDPATLHATYGDHFTGASLAAKWTRVGYVAGDEQYQMGGGTWLQIDTARAAANYYYQTAPAGDFTVVMKCTLLGNAAGPCMFGPLILDGSGNGAAAFAYSSTDAHYVGSVSAGSYSSTFQDVAGSTWAIAASGVPMWIKLKKVGTNYSASLSLNGSVWRKMAGNLSSAITPTRIGFGCIFNTPVSFAVDWFDVQ